MDDRAGDDDAVSGQRFGTGRARPSAAIDQNSEREIRGSCRGQHRGDKPRERLHRAGDGFVLTGDEHERLSFARAAEPEVAQIRARGGVANPLRTRFCARNRWAARTRFSPLHRLYDSRAGPASCRATSNVCVSPENEEGSR